MAADLAEIAYHASLRSLDKQEEVLAELRSRTAILVATSSLAASFLGEPAFDNGRPVAGTAALVAFAISVGASLYVLLPKRDLVFSLKGSKLYEELSEFGNDHDEVHRRLAYDLDRFWDENDPKLVRARFWFRIAVVALAAEVALLLISLGATLD